MPNSLCEQPNKFLTSDLMRINFTDVRPCSTCYFKVNESERLKLKLRQIALQITLNKARNYSILFTLWVFSLSPSFPSTHLSPY